MGTSDLPDMYAHVTNIILHFQWLGSNNVVVTIRGGRYQKFLLRYDSKYFCHGIDEYWYRYWVLVYSLVTN